MSKLKPRLVNKTVSIDQFTALLNDMIAVMHGHMKELEEPLKGGNIKTAEAMGPGWLIFLAGNAIHAITAFDETFFENEPAVKSLRIVESEDPEFRGEHVSILNDGIIYNPEFHPDLAAAVRRLPTAP